MKQFFHTSHLDLLQVKYNKATIVLILSLLTEQTVVNSWFIITESENELVIELCQSKQYNYDDELRYVSEEVGWVDRDEEYY